MNRKNGFSLIEVIVVVAIIGILSGIILGPLSNARSKARDVKRKAEIQQAGRLLSLSCFVPSSGPGQYDLAQVVSELISANPQYSSYISQIPKDPKTGTDSVTNYKYIVNSSGKCVLYANLENENERTNLTTTVATPGGGTGVYQAAEEGWNGTNKYFQVSN